MLLDEYGLMPDHLRDFTVGEWNKLVTYHNRKAREAERG